MLNILIDENIAFAKNVFSTLGKLTLLPGREITPNTTKEKDVLIVRSITEVDEKLLEKSNVKFVGTATIGVDHLDTDYLKSKDIFYCNAPGSNSYSAAEYVLVSLLNLAVKHNFKLKDKSIGIIGVGNIGSKVETFTKALGMKVLLNDPPLKDKTNDDKYLPLKEALSADIITIHVPYTKKGKYKTYHLFDYNILNNLKTGTVLINTSRGSVVDNYVLTNILDNKKLITVLDVWENEPEINLNLLEKVDIGTPHIAGYSLDGKINGTKVIYEQLCNFLCQKPIWQIEIPAISSNEIHFNYKDSIEKTLLSIINNVYNIKDDHSSLLKMLSSNNNFFDGLRKNYKIRREFFNYYVLIVPKYKKEKEILKNLRFKVKTI